MVIEVNKGFTIVELLAVIIVLAILGTIGVARVNNYINVSRSKALEMQYDSIVKAAESYASKHILDEITVSSTCSLASSNCCVKMPSNDEECYVTLSDLINEKLIEEVKNPKSGGLIPGSTLIKIRYVSNQFVAEVIR